MTTADNQPVPLGTEESTLPPTFTDAPVPVIVDPTIPVTYDPTQDQRTNYLSTNNPQ